MVRLFHQDVSVKSLLLAAFETIAIVLSPLCGAKLRFLDNPAEFLHYTALPWFALQTLIFVSMFQICFCYCDFYDLSATGNRGQQILVLAESMGAACLLLGLICFIFPGLLLSQGVLFISTALLGAVVMLSRLALDKTWSAAGLGERVVILGVSELGATVAREMERRGDLSIHLVGFVDARPQAEDRGILGYPVLGRVEDLETIALRHQIERIVVAMEDRRGQLPVSQLVKLRVQGVRIEDAHTTIASLSGRVWLNTVRPSWFVFSGGFDRSRLNLILKRSVDLAVGIVGLVVSSPVMIVLAAAVSIDSPGPIIYRQTRVGQAGRNFSLLKFRSMQQDAEAQHGMQWASEDDPRATRVGRFIRKYRLDELPQFVNVIRGEMSFVGPRPERPAFVARLREAISYYDERHSVRPGLTGWAQVQYGYGCSVEDTFRKLEYDLFYLQNMSLFFDLAIVLKTVRIVFTGAGGR